MELSDLNKEVIFFFIDYIHILDSQLRTYNATED